MWQSASGVVFVSTQEKGAEEKPDKLKCEKAFVGTKEIVDARTKALYQFITVPVWSIKFDEIEVASMLFINGYYIKCYLLQHPFRIWTVMNLWYFD